MALLSFVMDCKTEWKINCILATNELQSATIYVIDCIHICSKTRLYLYEDLTGDNIILKFMAWTIMPLLLILFASGFVHIVSPQVNN
jgi:hypothetical protein